MRRSWERALLVGVSAGALVVGCSDGDGDDAAPASSTVGSTTSTEPADPFAVPEVIDETYVRRVLTEIYRIQGDALRLAVERGEVLPDTVETLRTVYGDEEAARLANELLQVSRDGFPGIYRPPGDIAIDRLTVSAASANCLSVEVTLDFTKVASDGIPAADTVLYLAPNRDGRPPGWRVVDSSLPPADGSPGGSC